MDRKSEILAAAGNCFVKFGYEKTTLDDIAAEVGINKASFYYYFKNKAAIFTELIRREADDFIRALRNRVGDIEGCREKILAWVKEGFSYTTSNSILLRLSIESLKSVTPMIAEMKEYGKRQGTEFLKEILEEYRTRGTVVIENAGRTAQTIQDIVYAMKDYTYREAKLDTGNIADVNSMTEEIIYAVSLILDGIIAGERT